MRRLLIMIVMLLVLTPVCAAEYCYEYDESKITKEEIEAFIRDELYLPEDQDLIPYEYDLETAYYMISTNPVIITSYSKNNNIDDIKTDEYPSRTVVNYKNNAGVSCSMELAKNKDGRIYLLGISKNINNDLSLFEPSVINESLKKFDETVEKIELLRCSRYAMMLVRVITEKGDYIIPYNLGQEEISGIDYGVLKKAGNFFADISKIIDENYYIEHPDENGGLAPKNNYAYAKIALTTLLVFVICIGTPLLYRKKNRDKK